jgi:parallel beta-helix repeat protein
MANYPGSVVRQLNEKLGEIATPLDFGARGDGFTDDTAAINNAAAVLPYLYLPEDYTFLTSGLTLDSSKTGFRLFGGGRLKLKAGANAPLVFLNGATYVILHRVELDGNGVNQAISAPLLHIRNGAYARVEKCYIHDSKGDGVLIENLNGSALADECNICMCLIFSNAQRGVHLDYAGSPIQGVGDTLIRDNHINYNGLQGIYQRGGSANLIVGNNVLTNGSHGIELESVAGIVGCTRSIIAANQVRNNGGAGLYVHGIGAGDITISDNHFHFNNFLGGSDNLTIFDVYRPVVVGNYCGDSDFPARSQYPMQMNNCFNAVIVGNNFDPGHNGNPPLAYPLITNGTFTAWGNNGLDDRAPENARFDSFVAINQAVDILFRLAVTGDVKFEGDVRIRSGGLAALLMDISGVFRGKLLADNGYVYLRNGADRGFAIDQNNPSLATADDDFKAQRDLLAGRHLTVGGDVIHQGARVGFYSTAPATQAPASADLVDNSGGTGGGTIAAITDTTNAGSADVGPTKDAIASLSAKVNDCLAGLRRVGLIAQ